MLVDEAFRKIVDFNSGMFTQCCGGTVGHFLRLLLLAKLCVYKYVQQDW